MTVNVVSKDEMTVTPVIQVSSHDIVLFRDIRAAMGKMYTCRVIRRVYPCLSLRDTIEIYDALL